MFVVRLFRCCRRVARPVVVCSGQLAPVVGRLGEARTHDDKRAARPEHSTRNQCQPLRTSAVHLRHAGGRSATTRAVQNARGRAARALWSDPDESAEEESAAEESAEEESGRASAQRKRKSAQRTERGTKSADTGEAGPRDAA